jgi:hypothetical protein
LETQRVTIQTSINVTNNNSIDTCSGTLTIPWACNVDTENLIRELAVKQNITLIKKIKSDINNNLTGNIVQIIDERGHIRYSDVKSFDDTTITLVSSNKKEIIMTIDNFRKSLFTGRLNKRITKK